MTNLLVIAHRGASGYAPEHTFAAWDLALSQGADFLEQDLQLTRDGALVVLHDETLDRTLRWQGRPCRGRVRELDLEELRACDAGSWFNEARPDLARPEYAGQRLATLDEVLARYRGRASFYIETKQPESARGMDTALLDLLRRHELLGAPGDWRVLVQSFSEASLRILHAAEPGLPLIRLLDRGALAAGGEAELERIAEYAVGIGPHQADVDARLVATAHARCLVVHPYTVNRQGDLARVLAAGVDGVFSDFPDRVLAARPATEPRGPAAAAAAAAARARCLALSGRGGPAAGH